MSWNRSNGELKVASKPPSVWKGVVAGVVVVIVLAVMSYFFLPDEGPVPEQKSDRKSLIKDATPAKAPKADVADEAVAPKEAKEEWQDSFIDDPEKRMKFSTLFEARTNTDGIVVERFRLPNGKTWRRIVDPPPTFDNMADNAIATVISGNAGAPIPPVPGLDDANLDQEFAKAMASPIQIKETDSPRIVALKMAVTETKKEILRMIKAGDTRSVGEILQEHINLNNHAADMQAEAIKAAHKVREEMGEEAARTYLEKVNENLKLYGVDPVSIGTGRGRGVATDDVNTNAKEN